MSLIFNSTTQKTKNKGGVVLKGGNLSQNYLNLTNVVGNYIYNNYPYSSAPVELSTLSVKGISGGVFAYDRQRPLTKGTTPIININHTAHDLKTPGILDVTIDTNIHARTTNRNRLDTSAIRAKKYSMYTGKFDTGYPVVSNDNFGNDTAASLSRSNPGKLTLNLGKVIESKSYSPKTN